MLYYGWLGGYVGGYIDTREAAANARGAESAARRAENAMLRMEDQLERQALIIRSLLEMCARKGMFDDKEFREMVNEVDLSDGRLDGKYKPLTRPRSCPKCGKTNGRSAVRCLYCGEALPDRELV